MHRRELSARLKKDTGEPAALPDARGIGSRTLVRFRAER